MPVGAPAVNRVAADAEDYSTPGRRDPAPGPEPRASGGAAAVAQLPGRHHAAGRGEGQRGQLVGPEEPDFIDVVGRLQLSTQPFGPVDDDDASAARVLGSAEALR